MTEEELAAITTILKDQRDAQWAFQLELETLSKSFSRLTQWLIITNVFNSALVLILLLGHI